MTPEEKAKERLLNGLVVGCFVVILFLAYGFITSDEWWVKLIFGVCLGILCYTVSMGATGILLRERRRRKANAGELVHLRHRDFGDAACGARGSVLVARSPAVISCSTCREILALPPLHVEEDR